MQRQPRLVDPSYLAWLRKLPCCACGRQPSEAAHLRMGNLAIDKRPTGMGEKPSDFWATPLCSWCHRDDPQSQHNIGEKDFWVRLGIDPFALAIKLYAEYGGTGGTVRRPRKANFPKGRKIQSRGF
jgi:hypothetical protein